MNPLIAEIEKSAALTRKVGGPQCNEYLSALAALKLAVEALDRAGTDLADCRDNASVDFLGTGSDSKFARKEEAAWNKAVDDGLSAIDATLRAIAEKLGVKP